jgi:DNA-binding NtrC family response regulator
MRLFKIAQRTDANVLIVGPTGSGKSLLAREIHEKSSRRDKPFVPVNLATLHEGTLESELFGHERGAFTGADQRRVGKLEMASGGSVFLDEIGELSPRMQARLLEFIQSRKISPVGSNRELRLDVRVIAATHRNLQRAVELGEFREDLFHRLRVVNLELRPLREREEEFDELVHEALSEFCGKSGRNLLRLSKDVAFRLENYSWPGNIRELRNVLEYAVLASESDELKTEDLPVWFLESGEKEHLRVRSLAFCEPEGVGFEAGLEVSFRDAVDGFEKRYLERALGQTGWKINKTARKIGVNKTTLLRRIRAHQLNRDEGSLERLI